MVRDSLYRLPSIGLPELENISATVVVARDAAGKKIAVFFMNSDALFDLGSARLTSAATEVLDGVISAIEHHYPGGAVQVRGHTDATGSAAANQTLSEQRASAVTDHLAHHGIGVSRLSSVGFGSAMPLLEERSPSGSENAKAESVNRRVEIAVRGL